MRCPAITALQILPCADVDGISTPQHDGPDARTARWTVFELWNDGRSIEHDSYRTELAAVEVAQALAAECRAYVEPYPWVIAVCVADGWEVVPTDAGRAEAEPHWRFRRSGNGDCPQQLAQRNVFDAWRACLSYACTHG